MTSFLGHEKQQQVFLNSFAKGTLHHAWILAGRKGLGKAGFAGQAAQFLLDSHNDPKDFSVGEDNQAASLLTAGSHPDFRLIRRGAKGDKEEKKARDGGVDVLEEHELARNIKIAQIRGLQPLFATQPAISTYRVVVIDAIDDLERGGANALLKNLEEPPKNTVFLMVSHAPERLLPTIRSRCQILRFDPLTDDQMGTILSQKISRVDHSELQALITAGEGSPGQALQYVDAGLGELEQIANDIMRGGDRNNILKSDLARKLSLKAATPRYRAFLARAPSMMAQYIKASNSAKNIAAVEKWREATYLAAMAGPKALDNQAVVFQLGTLMASLAEHNHRA